MTSSSYGTRVPAMLRIVQGTAGKSLIVAISLPKDSKAPQLSVSANVLTVASALPTHDRAFWQRFVSSPVLLKISAIVRGLGLRQLNTGTGKVLFRYENTNQLADAVTDAAKRLPETSQGLVDAATDYNYAPLQEDIAQLFHRFGEEVWGADKERHWLLEASEGNPEYQRDLTYENDADKVVLMYHLRLWILVKAFNRTRNKTTKSRAWISSQAGATGRAKQDRSGQLNNQSPQDKKRPRRKYLSEEIIRNSSDESEEDPRPITPSLPECRRPVFQIDQTAPDAERPQDTEKHLEPGDKLDNTRLVSTYASSRKRKLTRQGLGACKSCQQRHQRCDRVRPVCGRCEKLGSICESADVTESSTTTDPVPRKHSTYPVYRSTNTGQNSGGQLVKNSTKMLATRKMPLTGYWSKNDWDTLSRKGDERETLLATMRSLGLRATLPHHREFRFYIDHFVSLGEDINKIAWSLSSKLSAAQLAKCAEDSAYLDDEIDTLFETYSSIWSLDADRAKLLAPGTDEHYSRDLFYEESEDQRLLWSHLHRWIFLMAFVIQKQIDGPREPYREKVPKSEDTKLPGDVPDDRQLDFVHMFDAPEDASSPDPLNLSHDSDPGIVNESPMNSPPSTKPSRRKLKHRNSSTTFSTQKAALSPLKQRRTTQPPTASPGHDLCALFLSYLETYTNPSFDELPALSHLTTELSLLQTQAETRILPSAYASPLASAFLTTCFPAWLRYRTEIVTVRRQLADMHDAQSRLHHHVAVQQRSRFATQLRLAREAFMAACYGELRAEQVIVRAVEGAMGAWGQDVSGQVRMAFLGMEEELGELGDELIGVGGRRWVMGKFPAMGSLDGVEEE